MSEKSALERANDEVSFICTDMHFDCNKYNKGKLISDSNSIRIFEFTNNQVANNALIVRVPYTRIGDVTFGLIGNDVTVGESN